MAKRAHRTKNLHNNTITHKLPGAKMTSLTGISTAGLSYDCVSKIALLLWATSLPGLAKIYLIDYEESYAHIQLLFCLSELLLYVPVNKNGHRHVGTIPPFYGTFTQH